MKSLGFDSIITNALVGGVGGAAGGADFDPLGKSEAEIQRFCQSYMTELHKYIGPDVDQPLMGAGVGTREVRLASSPASTLLRWISVWPVQAHQHACDEERRRDPLGWTPSVPNGRRLWRGELRQARPCRPRRVSGRIFPPAGKRCLITGCGKVALAVAQKLLELGAIPVTLSDQSGFVYEPEGFTASNLETIKLIKRDRGARVGRYIISSTTATFGPGDSVSCTDMKLHRCAKDAC
eukprot:scaffold721_cov235-Pinguiococcus_pyrenoidosus.AAC.10